MTPIGMGCRARGVTLVELVVFIVVVGIALSGVLLAFAATERGVPTVAQLEQARVLAASRMELVLGQKPVLGFDCFNAPLADPCEAAAAAFPCPGRVASAASACSVPAGYGVDVQVAALPGPRRQVTVQVQGPTGATLAVLTSEVDAD